MLMILVSLSGMMAACAAAGVLSMRLWYGAETLALASLLRTELRGVAQPGCEGDDSASPAARRGAALRALRDAASPDRPQPGRRQSKLGSDPWARCGIGLTALATLCLSVLAIAGVLPSPASHPVSATAREDEDVARLARYVRSGPAHRIASSGPMSTPQGPQGLPDVETMIARLAARLAAQPEDAEGWRMLGWSYAHTEQPAKAADAYGRAIALRPASPEWQSAYGEALVTAAAGTVTPQAIAAFNSALAIEPQNAKARYFLALSQAQTGNKRAAWAALNALERETTEGMGDEALTAAIREQIALLSSDQDTGTPPERVVRAAEPGEHPQLMREEIDNMQP